MPGPKGIHLSPEKRAALRRELLANPQETATSVGERVGVSKHTAQAERRQMIKEGLVSPDEVVVKQAAPEEASTPAHERRIVQLEDEVRELRGKLKETHRDNLSDDAIREILHVIADAPEHPPTWTMRLPAGNGTKTPEVPVVIWSDWHVGEVVEPAEVSGVNAYNLDIAEKRIRRLYDSTIDLCMNHGPGEYPGIVINLLGDFCSGGLHPELAKSDEEDVIPTVLRCRDILITGLERMVESFGRIYVPCAAGNHGRIGPKPEFKRYYAKN